MPRFRKFEKNPDGANGVIKFPRKESELPAEISSGDFRAFLDDKKSGMENSRRAIDNRLNQTIARVDSVDWERQNGEEGESEKIQTKEFARQLGEESDPRLRSFMIVQLITFWLRTEMVQKTNGRYDFSILRDMRRRLLSLMETKKI